MFDIYILIVPIIGLLIFLTLITLKYTLAQPKINDLNRYQRKIQKVQNNNVKQQQVKNTDQLQQTGYKKTLKYLLKNYTLSQFYYIRRSRNKIPFLLSISLITLLSYLFDIQYILSIIGGIISIIYAFGKMLTNQYQPDINNSIVNPIEVKAKQKINHKLQMVFVAITICLDLFLLGLLYKNYRNTMLINSSINLFINLALDNFIVKPILLMFFAIPIRNIQFVDEFINAQIQIVQILQQIRVIKQNSIFISAMSPKKHRMSPSKVPRAILQIQARIKSEQKQKYLSTFQLHKGIRKQKLSPLSLRKKSHQNQQGNNSLISLFNSSQKKKNIRQNNQSFDIDKRQQQKVQDQNKKNHTIQYQQTSKFSFQHRKKNKLYSSKTVLINAQNSIINGLDVQNQQQQDFRASSVFSNNLKFQKSQKSLKDNDSKLGQNDQIQLISLNNCLNDQIRTNKSGIKQQNQSQFNQMNRAISSLEQQSIIQPSSIHTSRKIGLLKIHQDKNGQDLQQIDLNSPQRRRDQLSRVNQQSDKDKIKKKKPHKKYSLDPNRHVIKHTTGQPYLEFLPNLLNKQRQQKKKRTQQFSQQQFSRKIDLLNNDSRFSKSVKRTKNNKDPIVRQNDQNRIPEFIVQDFQS